jgi:hypothetical protein
MKVRLCIAGTALFLFLFGCSSTSNSPDGGGGPSLTVSPQTLTVVAGSSASSFGATLTGASGTISWSLNGPGTIGTMSGSTTSYTPPANVSSTTTATLTASAAGLTASATITINPASPATITVNGTVLFRDGEPVAGAQVAIGATITTTASDGTFSISGVTTPYDLISIATNGTQQYGVVFQGLTRPDPTIPYLGTALGTATVTGTISGGNVIPTAGETTAIAWGSPQVLDSPAALTSSAYTLSLQWSGSTTTTGKVHALQWTNSATAPVLPTAFTYYGSSATVTASTATPVTADVTLAAITSTSISGSVTIPSATGYSLAYKLAEVAFDDGAFIGEGLDDTASTTFTYVTPSITDGKISLIAEATYTQNNLMLADSLVENFGNEPNATGVSLVLPEVALPVSPASGTMGVTSGPAGTLFTWTPFAGGINLVEFTSANHAFYYVLTTATTTTIPDLSGEGLGLPTGGVSYSWGVIGYGPWANMDAFCGGHAVLPPGVPTVYESIPVLGYSFTTQ